MIRPANRPATAWTGGLCGPGARQGCAGVSPPAQPNVAPAPLRARGFTLIELLIVIVVIGLLIAAIFLVASSIHRNQKVKFTETTMRSLTMAIEQVATENPLKNVYDVKDQQTFGPYPPYMLDSYTGAPNNTSVQKVLEPAASYGNYSYVLEDRLHRDLGNRQGNVTAWTQLATTGPQIQNESNDDIRALYTYLKVYSPALLSQVPESAVKPILALGKLQYVNPKGTGPAPGQPGSTWLDVFGIYDAWGVPLDYFLYVKLEWAVLPNVSPPNNIGWRVTDRVPVLRSHGISYDEYVAEGNGTDERDPDKWIFSEPFRSPPAAQSSQTFRKDGRLPGNPTTPGRDNGWARALAAGDLQTTGPDQTRWFGYVP